MLSKWNLILVETPGGALRRINPATIGLGRQARYWPRRRGRSAFGQANAGARVRILRDQLLLSCAFQYASTFWLS